jgi:signal transduction histidine kinase/DNA-binding LacI/PurR family transcriptional regulator
MKTDQKMSSPKPNRRRTSRPTIGLLVGRIGDHRYQGDVWPGVADVAQEQDASLICFVGGALHSPYGLDSQRNIVYELPSASSIDGLVALSGTLGHHIGPEQLKLFFQRYGSLPIVGTSLTLEGIPSILVDNESGMREAVSHLIEVHARRRIAFICGPVGHPEAEQRFKAYVDVLKTYNIPLDPKLIIPGDFVYSSGMAATKMLLDQRKVKFDAIVVANDEMAFGVLAVLQERGIYVPDEVSIVGFDDIEESQFTIPPLTTTKQPLYEQGRRAAETLMTLITGGTVPEKILLPSKLVVRQSCGCFHPTVIQAAAGRVKWTAGATRSAFSVPHEKILQELNNTPLPAGMDPKWAETLLDAFIAEYKGTTSGAYLPALQALIRQVMELNGFINTLHDVISILRKNILPHIKGRNDMSRFEDICQQSSVLIGEMAQAEQAHLRLQVVRQAVTFSAISESLMTTFDLNELANATVRELPHLGVESCYLCLYEQPVEGNQSPPAEWSRLILAYDSKGRIDINPGGVIFRTRELVPDHLLSRQGRYAMILEPLHFGNDVQFGYVIMGPLKQQGGAFREIMLSRQISTALRVSLLLQERSNAEESLKKYSEKLEEMVDERTGELQDALQKSRLADQLKSEFVANVNHELRTPLTNLILYYQLLSAHPEEKTKERLDVIGREIQRLRILIENLLNLSRLDLTKVNLRKLPQDLNKLIRSLVDDRVALAEKRGLTLRADLAPGLPSIWVDESTIVQAISNLLTNAMNYTPSGGEVQIRTKMVEDSSGNQWTIISVQDTGPGINNADLPHIFERFYRGKAGRETGAPGTGLGLAIVKEVVKKHHGRIDVENIAGGSGTIFTIRLPIEGPEAAF